MKNKKVFFLFIKRFFDVFLSMFFIFLLFPFLFLIGVIIKLDSKGPIFFKQKRVGKYKKMFTIYKFRTMKIEAPHNAPTHTLENPDVFITRFGLVLRKFSIDELPQLINILIGDMSFIGPRPALWNQEDLILERDRQGANSIRPGLSGWAQTHGRDGLSIREKAQLDCYYYGNMSFVLDFKIFFLTIGKVLKHEGVHEGKRKT